MLLDVQQLKTAFHTRAGIVRAVDALSFTIAPGETLGIVGESGSGKSVAMYSLLGLLPMPPARIEGGSAQFNGRDLLQLSPREMRQVRGREIAMIFQDPMTALNPYMKIGEQVMEPLILHERCSRAAARARAEAALREVGIHDAAARMDTYPHQLSGGMRQRVMIAMALITRPALIIADEPTTALDVTVQAQILELIARIQAELNSAVILISHDLGVVSGMCHRTLVMYAGRIVEAAETAAIFRQPRHPYSHALMASMPSLHAPGERLSTIPGAPPDLSRPVHGCPFAPRCPHALEKCVTNEVRLLPVGEAHHSACLRVQNGEISLTSPLHLATP